MKTTVNALFICCVLLFAFACNYGNKPTNNQANASYTMHGATPPCVINELEALADAKNKCIKKLNERAEEHNKINNQVWHWNFWTGLIGASGAAATGTSAVVDKASGGDQSAYIVASGVITGVAVPTLLLVRHGTSVDEELARQQVKWETVNSNIQNADALVQKLLPDMNKCEPETIGQLVAMTLTLRDTCN